MSDMNGQRLAAIYARVSTSGQEKDGTSLDTQEARCREYATAKGYRVETGNVYRETFTGAELWDRPKLTQLRTALRQRRIGVIVAYAIDRLSRDPVHLGVIISEADHFGVQVEFVTEPLDASPEGELIRFVRGYAAKVEHEKIRERGLRGKHARLASGKLHRFGPELYGYRRDNDKGVRVMYPPEAAIVRQIFAWYVEEHLGIRTIATRLNNEGIPSPSVNKRAYNGLARQPRWGKGQVYWLLIHPAYKGETISWRHTGNWHLRPENEWLRLPETTTPALVPATLWEQAQHRLATNRGAEARNQARPYLLRGRIRCARCGLPLRPCPERGRRMYRCASREKPSGPCGALRVPVDLVETGVWAEIERLLQDPQVIAQEVERRRAIGPDPALRADQDAHQRRLAILDKKQGQLLRAFREEEEAPLPWDLLRRELAALEQEKSQIARDLATLVQRLAAQEEATTHLESLTAYCRRVAEHLASFGFDDKRMALEALDVRVMANGREWRLTGSIPMEGHAGTMLKTSE
jgi:site-specific DNA recombinase